MRKKLDRRRALARARLRLRQAIDAACIARGEAQWMNGYRTGIYAAHLKKHDDDDSLYRKETERFKYCAIAEASAERAMRAFAKAIREAPETAG